MNKKERLLLALGDINDKYVKEAEPNPMSGRKRILSIADKIVVIADGQIQNVGKKEEVLPKLLAAESCRVLTEKM